MHCCKGQQQQLLKREFKVRLQSKFELNDFKHIQVLGDVTGRAHVQPGSTWNGSNFFPDVQLT